MPTRQAHVLMIDDDEAEFVLVSEMLRDKEAFFNLIWVDNLQKAFEHLQKEKVDVILLDLFIRESRGLETFKNLKTVVRDIPIVILSGLDDERSALEAIQQGAQDFLVKDHIDGNRLSRVIQYAIQRNETQKDPKNIGLIDPFTGFYNRQGFFTMVDDHLKAAQRTGKKIFMCFGILNDLKKINDEYGKAEGDHALLTVADILRESFRSADPIARMGADEFVILVREEQASPKVIFSRIKKNQKYYNAQFNRYRIPLSMSSAYFEPDKNLSVKELSMKIDQVFRDYKTKASMDNVLIPSLP